MKVALLSDIHGNAIALEKVLKEVDQEGIQKLFIMGDFVGYYYSHQKVFELLDRFQWEGIQGNHDALLADFVSGNTDVTEPYRSGIGSSLDVALQDLTKEQIDMLVSLPKTKELVLEKQNILLCHGAPWDQNQYMYPDSEKELFDRLFALDYDFIMLGHTHYPMVKKQGEVTVVNPGSVGQPRDEGSNASWAIVDLQTGEIELRRTRFSPDELLQQIKERNPELTYLREVLLRKNSARLTHQHT